MVAPAFVTPPKQPEMGPGSPKKGGFPWLYVLLGCGGIIFLGIVAVGVGSYFFVKAVKHEINQHVVITDPGPNGEGGSVELKGVGPDGANVKVGSSGKAPTWMPVYPGSDPKNFSSVQVNNEDMTTYMYETSDTPETIGKFYEDKLKPSGFECIVNNASQDNQKNNLFHATKKDEGYAVQITSVSEKEGHTTVTVVAIKGKPKVEKTPE